MVFTSNPVALASAKDFLDVVRQCLFLFFEPFDPLDKGPQALAGDAKGCRACFLGHGFQLFVKGGGIGTLRRLHADVGYSKRAGP